MKKTTKHAALVIVAASLLVLLPCVATAGTIFGTQIKTWNTFGPAWCVPPTSLFSIDTATDAVTGYGNVTLDGEDVRLDGLAINSVGKGVGFVIENPEDGVATSQLVQINGGSLSGADGVSTTALGAVESYVISGAAYDPSDTLWAIDNVAGTLLKIDDTNGSVISTIALTNDPSNTLNYGAQNNSSIDVTFDSQGVGYLVGNTANIWVLDTSTGVLDDVAYWGASGITGCAIDPDDDNTIYGLRVFGGADAIWTYDIAAGTNANLGTITAITGNEGGRGDMANGDIAIPEPSALLLSILGIAGLHRRRR